MDNTPGERSRTAGAVPGRAGSVRRLALVTRVEGYGGCSAGIDVQLWTVQGGGHMDPLDAAAFGESMWGFMAAHAQR